MCDPNGDDVMVYETLTDGSDGRSIAGDVNRSGGRTPVPHAIAAGVRGGGGGGGGR
jgi:hypothetical protein